MTLATTVALASVVATGLIPEIPDGPILTPGIPTMPKLPDLPGSPDPFESTCQTCQTVVKLITYEYTVANKTIGGDCKRVVQNDGTTCPKANV